MVERRLFGNLVVSDDTPKNGGRGRTLPVSLAVHGVVLAAVVIVPLMSAGEVPPPTNSVRAFFSEPVVPAPAPPPPPPPPRGDPAPTRPRTSTPAPSTTALVPPTEIIDHIEPDAGGGGALDGVQGGETGGETGGSIGGVLFGTIGTPVTASEVPPILRVGGNVKPPTKIKDVRPVYPALARSARMQGVVILECTIDPHGRVQDVRVLRGIPLLDQAATDAVRQWAYTPTLLNGVPTAVVMTVTVGFTLQ